MSLRNVRLIALCLSLMAGACTAHADEPKTGADAANSSAAKTKQSIDDIEQDFQTESAPLRAVLSSHKALTDAAQRTEAAPKLIPLMKRLIAILDELKATGDPHADGVAEKVTPQLTAFLALFGDKPTITQLEEQASGTDIQQAVNARGALLMAHWIEAGNDPAAQQPILDDAKSLARDNPTNERLSRTLTSMSEIGAASVEMSDKIMDVAAAMNTATGQDAKEQVARDEKLRSLENKPVTIQGVRLDGSHFSTADWRGKVIFVDFWATWCAPCRAALPDVKKAYADFHDKGLEVVGVSCDNEGSDLTEFLSQNKDMPWPQLFDVKNPGWNAIATSFGIESIPTMFLIDKKGILRSARAYDIYQDLIPKLLDEKAD